MVQASLGEMDVCSAPLDGVAAREDLEAVGVAAAHEISPECWVLSPEWREEQAVHNGEVFGVLIEHILGRDGRDDLGHCPRRAGLRACR